MNALKLHPDDNVVTAVSDLAQGTGLELADAPAGSAVLTCEPIPFGHKVAIAAIPMGGPVIKYGARIGLARVAIASGQHVHVHNLRSVRGAASS